MITVYDLSDEVYDTLAEYFEDEGQFALAPDGVPDWLYQQVINDYLAGTRAQRRADAAYEDLLIEKAIRRASLAQMLRPGTWLSNLTPRPVPSAH